MVVTSNKPFSAWGEIFGDEVTATAMIDRLVHHAEILSLKGDSFRLRDKDLGSPPARTDRRARFASPYGLRFAGALLDPRGGQLSSGAKGSVFNWP